MEPCLDVTPQVPSVIDGLEYQIDVSRFEPIAFNYGFAFTTHALSSLLDDRGNVIGVEHVVEIDFTNIPEKGFRSCTRYFPNGAGVHVDGDSAYIGYDDGIAPGPEEDEILLRLCEDGHFSPSSRLGHIALCNVVINQGF